MVFDIRVSSIGGVFRDNFPSAQIFSRRRLLGQCMHLCKAYGYLNNLIQYSLSSHWKRECNLFRTPNELAYDLAHCGTREKMFYTLLEFRCDLKLCKKGMRTSWNKMIVKFKFQSINRVKVVSFHMQNWAVQKSFHILFHFPHNTPLYN